jgi:hypothetical protein
MKYAKFLAAGLRRQAANSHAGSRIVATMNLPDSMATALMSLIAAGVGAYFGSYFKKKGENLAPREDVEAITRKREETKDLISNRS